LSLDRYVDLAVNHSVWVSLQSRDLRNKYEKGAYSPDLDEARDREQERALGLRSRLKASFAMTAVAAVVACTIGFLIGAISLDYDYDLKKIVACFGTFLMAWATLLELGTGLISWSGQALSELVHPVLFQLIFILGLTGVLISIII